MTYSLSSLAKMSKLDKQVSISKEAHQVIASATANEINQQLQDFDTSELFIFLCFVFANKQLDDTCYQSMLAHAHLPLKVLKILTWFKPDLVAQSQASDILALRLLEPETKTLWQSLPENKPTSLLDFIEVIFDSDTVLQMRANYLIALGGKRLIGQLPHYVMDYYTRLADADDLNWLARKTPDADLAPYLTHKQAKIRNTLAKRHDLSKSNYQQLANDSSVQVRKTLAENESVPDGVLNKLLQSGDTRIIELIKKRDKLSDDILAQLEKLKQTEYSDTKSLSISQVCTLLNSANTSADEISNLLTHPDPFVRAAGGFHKNANEAYYAALMNEADDWQKVAVALYSTTSEHLIALSKSKAKGMDLCLAHNPSIPEQVINTLISSSDQASRKAIAANFFDNKEILKTVLEANKKPTKNSWETLLSIALTPDILGKEVTRVANHENGKCTALNKAVVRHAKCSPSLYRRLGAYLPNDAKLNSEKENKLAKGKKFARYDRWQIESAMSNDSIFQCVSDTSLRGDEITLKRQAMSVSDSHIGLVLACLFENDVHILKRFVEVNKHVKYPEFVYQGIARLGNLAVKRALVKNIKNLPKSVLTILSEEKDQGLLLLLSKYKGFKVATSDKQTIDLNNLKTLGNKQSRMDYAKNSDKLDILLALTKDKVKDVRIALANRRNLHDDVKACLVKDELAEVRYEVVSNQNFKLGEIISLLNEEDHQVLNALLSRIRYRISDQPVSPEDRERIENRALDIACSDEFSDTLREIAISICTPNERLDALVYKVNDQLQKALIKKIKSPELFDRIFFDYVRTHGGAKVVRFGLFGPFTDNPLMTIDKANQLLEISEKTLLSLIKAKNPEVSLFALTKLPKDDTKYDERLRFYAPFTSEQIEFLFDNYYDKINMHSFDKYAQDMSLELITKLGQDRKKRKCLYFIFSNQRNIAKPILAQLLAQDDADLNSSLVYRNKLTSEQIDKMLQLKTSKSLLEALVWNQALTFEQEKLVIENGNLDSKVQLAKALARAYSEQSTSIKALELLALSDNDKVAKQAKKSLARLQETA